MCVAEASGWANGTSSEASSRSSQTLGTVWPREIAATQTMLARNTGTSRNLIPDSEPGDRPGARSDEAIFICPLIENILHFAVDLDVPPIPSGYFISEHDVGFRFPVEHKQPVPASRQGRHVIAPAEKLESRVNAPRKPLRYRERECVRRKIQNLVVIRAHGRTVRIAVGV